MSSSRFFLRFGAKTTADFNFLSRYKYIASYVESIREMAAGFSIEVQQFIKESRENGKTHQGISVRLQELYPGQRGFSVKSVERFCQQHCIPKMSQLRVSELRRMVATAVSQVSTSLSCNHSDLVKLLGSKSSKLTQPGS